MSRREGSARQAVNKRFYILALATATMVFAMGMPGMALPVLFREMSGDLDLSLVRIGSIWGFGALTGAIFGVLSGVVGDLRRTKWVIGIGCIGGGLIGAARGLSNGYLMLAVTSLLLGVTGSMVPVNVHKTVSQWFSRESFGKANSVLAVGVGVGTTLGATLSASVLSPWLGGWRHVTYFYGAMTLVIGVLWLLSPEAPEGQRAVTSDRVWRDFREAFARVLSLKAFWTITLVGLFFGAANQGLTGYLSLYLADSGWAHLSADSALSVYSAASIVGVVPLVMLAERLRSNRALLLLGAGVHVTGLILISTFPNASVWPVLAIMGLFREAFIVVTITHTVQIAGIGPKLAGTALGASFAFSGIGRFGGPPLGNSLAHFGAGYPFLLWAALAGVSVVMLLFMKRMGKAVCAEVMPEIREIPL
jgi:MFS family permease